MDLSSLRTLIGQTALIDVEACRRELEHIRRGRGLFDAREVEVLARLDELTVESPAIHAPPQPERRDADEVDGGSETDEICRGERRMLGSIVNTAMT
jgi:hypothetical protein